jgi:hypothetical protein
MNSFLNGKSNAEIVIGKGCIIMPHTIIDASEPITIPEGSLVWGFIDSDESIKTQSIQLDELKTITEKFTRGDMTFEGNGNAFVSDLKERINRLNLSKEMSPEKIYTSEDTSVFIIQPYFTGPKAGIYPSITIKE